MAALVSAMSITSWRSRNWPRWMVRLGSSLLCTNHIFLAGNEAQKRKYVPRLAGGEWLGAWGLTEAGAGSDASNSRTTAVKKGDRYVLNGNKTFITNGHYADVAVVIASTDKSKGTHGLSAFVVEKGTN